MAAPRAAPRMPLAGGGQETLLSEVGARCLLPLLTTADACALRLVCRECLAAVTAHPWEDAGTVIHGSLRAWRACFPRALAANVRQWSPAGAAAAARATPLTDADCEHLAGLRELHMAGCTSVTDAAFAHLVGIRRLDMSYCSQPALTGAALAHLRGVQALSLEGCDQAALAHAAALAPLAGVQVLNVSGCLQLTDAAFAHLRGVRALAMEGCCQPGVTDAALAHLRGAATVLMGHCDQPTITAAGLAHLAGARRVGMRGCPGVGAAEALGLRVDLAPCSSGAGLDFEGGAGGEEGCTWEAGGGAAGGREGGARGVSLAAADQDDLEGYFDEEAHFVYESDDQNLVDGEKALEEWWCMALEDWQQDNIPSSERSKDRGEAYVEEVTGRGRDSGCEEALEEWHQDNIPRGGGEEE